MPDLPPSFSGYVVVTVTCVLIWLPWLFCDVPPIGSTVYDDVVSRISVSSISPQYEEIELSPKWEQMLKVNRSEYEQLVASLSLPLSLDFCKAVVRMEHTVRSGLLVMLELGVWPSPERPRPLVRHRHLRMHSIALFVMCETVHLLHPRAKGFFSYGECLERHLQIVLTASPTSQIHPYFYEIRTQFT